MTLKPGSKNLITDVPGLNVGNAEDHILKSGVSVLTSSNPMTASYCVMGGAPGTRETDLLEPDKTVHGIDAIVLSGGSAFGLDATNGVVEYSLKRFHVVFSILEVQRLNHPWQIQPKASHTAWPSLIQLLDKLPFGLGCGLKLSRFAQRFVLLH